LATPLLKFSYLAYFEVAYIYINLIYANFYGVAFRYLDTAINNAFILSAVTGIPLTKNKKPYEFKLELIKKIGTCLTRKRTTADFSSAPSYNHKKRGID